MANTVSIADVMRQSGVAFGTSKRAAEVNANALRVLAGWRQA